MTNKTIEPFQEPRDTLMKTDMKAFNLIRQEVALQDPFQTSVHQTEQNCCFLSLLTKETSEMEPGCWRSHGLCQRLVACYAALERTGSDRRGSFVTCSHFSLFLPTTLLFEVTGPETFRAEIKELKSSSPSQK